MTTEALLQIGAPVVCTVVVGLTGWSLKRNVAELDGKITTLAASLAALSASVGAHDRSLAAGAEKFDRMEKDIQGLLERERERGCFSRCLNQVQKAG